MPLLGRACPSYAAHCAIVNDSPCCVGDPFVGGALPGRELLVVSIELGLRAMGEEKGELLRPPVVPLQLLPPLSIKNSDQSAMIGVVARHSDAHAPKSSTVSFPS